MVRWPILILNDKDKNIKCELSIFLLKKRWDRIATVSLNNYLDDENIFTIVYKAEKRVISYIIIKADSVDNRVDTKELGFLFLVNADYQGKGIRSETIPLILNYLFSNSIWKVYAGCFWENKGSKALFGKSDFRFEQESAYDVKTLGKEFYTFEYFYTKEIWQNKIENHRKMRSRDERLL